MLKVYIDFKSPYAFIAMAPTYALEDEFGIEIDWYPLTLDIGSFLGTAKTNKAGKVVENNRSPHQWLAVKYAYMDARRYANLRSLTLRGPQKIWDSSIAAIAMVWAKQAGRDVLKRYSSMTFDGFWKRELDIEDPSVITALLEEAGANTDEFIVYLEGRGREHHDKLQDEILDLGYFGVPTYVIEDEVYFGREHLPRVRWHLAGRQGALPDIANDSVLAL
jgi:2-hydroxychromene-2-carboxylate isomerase